MRRLILIAILLSFVAASGCTYVSTAQGGNTSKTNEAWFTETSWIPVLMIPYKSRVFYCPPMGTGGASTCIEAEYIENAPSAPAAPAPAPTPAPAPAPASPDKPDEGGGE